MFGLPFPEVRQKVLEDSYRSCCCKSWMLISEIPFPLLKQHAGMFDGCHSCPSTSLFKVPVITLDQNNRCLQDNNNVNQNEFSQKKEMCMKWKSRLKYNCLNFLLKRWGERAKRQKSVKLTWPMTIHFWDDPQLQLLRFPSTVKSRTASGFNIWPWGKWSVLHCTTRLVKGDKMSLRMSVAGCLSF